MFGIWTEINNKSDPNYCVQIRYLESRLDWLYLHYQYWADNSQNWIEIYTPTAILLMTWSYLHLSPPKLGLETGMICDFPCYKISVKPIFHEASNPSESSSSPLVLVRDHLLWNKRQGINIIMSIVITRRATEYWLSYFQTSIIKLNYINGWKNCTCFMNFPTRCYLSWALFCYHQDLMALMSCMTQDSQIQDPRPPK